LTIPYQKISVVKSRYCRTLVGGRKFREIISRKNSGVELIGKILAGTLDRKSLTEDLKVTIQADQLAEQI
jgi:hypothetical protein